MAAERVGLSYASDTEPGLRRVRRGKGFEYRDGRITKEETLARIASLVIPPAWDDVWICADPQGHLQATGRDARGRKQYRYHRDWHEARSESKYGLLVPFGEALPGLRARVEHDLGRQGLTRDRVLALAVSLMDETLIRVGNAEYARTNGSFGLTTLRDRHAEVRGATLTLSFRGKSGIEHALKVNDRRLARLVKQCRDLPGYSLFQYLDEEGGRQSIDSGMVNGYLREATGDDFTAKLFRTWGGTVRAAEILASCGAPESESAAAQTEVACVKEVAEVLGNTVAVCRSHYLHPAVLDAYREGKLSARLKRRNAGNTPAGLTPSEAAVLDLLRDAAS